MSAESDQRNIRAGADRVEQSGKLIAGHHVDPATTTAPPRQVSRPGRGRLAGEVVRADDWDSAKVNESIARDFGLPLIGMTFSECDKARPTVVPADLGDLLFP